MKELKRIVVFKMLKTGLSLTSDVVSFLMMKIGLLLRREFEYPNSRDVSRVYKITRKGVMMLQRIKENPEKPDLLIRDAEWDSWVK